MYRVDFNGLSLFRRYDSFEEAVGLLQTSESVVFGKVYDFDGNTVFSIDRRSENEKVKASEDIK